MNFNIDTPEGMKNACDWQRALLDAIRDGGEWAVPRVASIYTVDHKTKTLRRTGMCPDRTINRVCEQIGWIVVD